MTKDEGDGEEFWKLRKSSPPMTSAMEQRAMMTKNAAITVDVLDAARDCDDSVVCACSFNDVLLAVMKLIINNDLYFFSFFFFFFLDRIRLG